MKKKVLIAFLSMSMLGTSLAPVSAAEFTSGEEAAVVQEEVEPDLTIDDFSEGDSEETPVFNNDIANSDAANYEEDDEINVKSIHIIKQPTKDTYYYGLDAEVVGDLDFSGVTAQVLYKDGTTEIITFSNNDEDVEDHHGNTFSIFMNYDDYLYDEDDDLEIKTYTVVVRENFSSKSSDPVTVKVVSPEELSVIKEGSASTISASKSKAFAKFIPEHTGIYTVTYNTSEGKKSAMVMDSDLDGVNVTTDGDPILRAGQTYYIQCDTDEDASEVSVDPEFKVGIASMELVKEPTITYSYQNVVKWDGFMTRGAEVKINYTDGTSEVISGDARKAINKYGQRLVPTYNADPDQAPVAGKYKMYLTVQDTDASVMVAEGEIKSSSDMPTIDGSGTVTVDTLGSYNGWCRLKTGNETTYNIECVGYGMAILKGSDYVMEIPEFYDLPGKYSAVLEPNSEYFICTGPGSNVTTDTITFKATPGKINLSSCIIDTKNSCTYTGKALKPAVSVTYGYANARTTLKEGTDYTVTYSSNKNVGTAKVKITGKGKYTGSVTRTFKIVLGKPAIKSAAKSGTSAVKVSWSKVQGASGYEVYRSTGKTWTKVGTTKSTSFTDKKVKKGTTYSYKVRAYTAKKTYGGYSKTLKVKR
ncbi:hypothetical protein [Blautia wexlerae]|uniref:hypothetical protein n=1 Tax=Blautia wexlerae TaxID=418240 RepID=UPI00040D3679|nr:hypothetical protein [Blautia wexlerae]